MKKNIFIIIAGIMVLMSSCSKDFLTVNEKNPNSPSVVDPKLVLPAAENAITATMNNPRRFDFVYLWHGLWSVSQSYSQPQNLTQYKLINSDYQVAFREFYLAGSNLDAIEQQSAGANKVYYYAIAKILKAYIFQNLVDCWGDVPYTEAFKTASGNLKPKYDKQKDIYEDLIKQIDTAMVLIQGADIAKAEQLSNLSDIVYRGDMDLWLKFANTLKLRILVHQSGMSGRDAYIKSNIAKTSAIGYIGVGEGAMNNPPYIVSKDKMNPFYEYFYTNAGTPQSDATSYYFAGTDALELLKATSDPRLGKFYLPYSGTSYQGNVFGTPSTQLNINTLTSKLGYIKDDAGTIIGTPTEAAPLLTDFESLFIQSEAAQRGFITGDAKALYESAVNQSFIHMKLTAAEATTLLGGTSNKANFDNATDKLEIIITQKWIALNGVAPVEIWTDYRRTGFPSGLQFSKETAKASPTPPIRLLYPQEELNVNGANVEAVGTINQFTSKIFWQNR